MRAKHLAALAILGLLALAGAASAHSRVCLQADGTQLDRGGHGRAGPTGATGDCPDGDVVEFVIGWRDEPPFATFKNGADIGLRTPAGDVPVKGVTTLNATYTFGNESFPLALRAQFGRDGWYTDEVIPTRPGTYTLRVHGSVTWDNRTWPVDFSMQPATVEPPRDIEFPAKPADPLPALEQRVAAAEAANGALEARLKALEDRAPQASRGSVSSEGGNATPGFEALAVLAAAGTVAWAGRRRR